jgi:peroxiredoxin
VLCSVLAAFAGTVPRQAPEFTIRLADGKQVMLSQFKGKVVAVAFILTYCPHCQKTVGFLAKEQNDFGPRGFQVLASAIEDGAAKALPDFLKRFNPPFPVGYNARPAVLEFLQHPVAARLFMPQLVYVDRTGIIRAQYTADDSFMEESHQEENMRNKMQELLNEGAPAPAKKPAETRRKTS